MAEHKALRLFIGAAISAEAAEQLRHTAEALAASASRADLMMRWVAPANYHVTVKFLGWVKPEAELAIRDAVTGALAGAERFDLALAGLGAFPTLSRARVLWAGLQDQSALESLSAVVEDAVEPLGFARENRPYHAHVTLARLKKIADLSALVASSPEQTYSPARCKSLNLYQSVMSSKGSTYEVRFSWPLADVRRQSGELKGESDT